MATTAAQKRATAKWNSRNQVNRSIAFYPSKDDDAALLAHLDAQPNKGAYIKELIRNDMDASQTSPKIPNGQAI